MQVSINVVLNQEDIDKGLTATDAVYLAFPNAPVATVTQELKSEPVHNEEASINNELNATVDSEGASLQPEEEYVRDEDIDSAISPEAQAILDTPAPATAAVDSAGIPWNKDIHSSNKKFYGAGNAEEGRWMWKKGSDKDTREAVAQSLVVATPSPVVAAETGEATGVLGTPAPANEAVVVPVATPAVVGVPTPENAAPAENSPEVAAQPVTTGPSAETGITWIEFVKSVTANNITPDMLNEQLALQGLDQMALLSPGPGGLDNPQRIAVATALGMI